LPTSVCVSVAVPSLVPRADSLLLLCGLGRVRREGRWTDFWT
jgi:hypothetical protein